MEKVIAVVVTHNRLSLLIGCIEALRNQTRKIDAILVVNNSSTDGTETWLRSQKDIEVINQSNVGGAGGFKTAIESGFKKGFEWIWCMDDDGLPKEDALEKLLAVDDTELLLLNCAVINKEDKKTFVWKTGNYKTIDEVDNKLISGVAHPFNGTLINRRIIERVGVPKAHFFLWGDETEYLYRITRKNKIPVITVADSIHYHPPCSFSLRDNYDFSTSWKMYFYLRNRFQVNKTKFSNTILAYFGYACFIGAFACSIMLFQKTDKMKKLGFIVWPLSDAIVNDFSATPDYVLERLRSENEKQPVKILMPLRNFFGLFFLRNAKQTTAATA